MYAENARAITFFERELREVDVVVGDTRAVCNPFGYARRELNSAFRDKAELDV